jgi:iron complex outermembrane receptor protein
LLNGRQQASSGDNRAVEFDQYPSELLASVVIYKTPDANIAGFGCRARPICAPSGRWRSRSARSRSTSAARLNGTGSKLNKDVKRNGRPRIGQLHRQDHARARHRARRRLSRFAVELGTPASTITSNSAAATRSRGSHRPTRPIARDLAFPTGQEIFAYSRTNKRLAGIGILEWEPSDRVHTILDLYYSRFKQRETMRGAQWFDNVWVDNQTTPTS